MNAAMVIMIASDKISFFDLKKKKILYFKEWQHKKAPMFTLSLVFVWWFHLSFFPPSFSAFKCLSYQIGLPAVICCFYEGILYQMMYSVSLQIGSAHVSSSHI